MEFEWDEAKRRINLAKHGLDFEVVAGLDWQSAVIRPGLRFQYGEDRFRAFCILNDELFSVAYTMRANVTRILSFRRANRKERKLYAR